MNRDFIKNRIIYFHNTKNISARALSLELGMSSEYINQVENGKISPSTDFLMSFCEYFGITMGEFFQEELKYPKEFKVLINEASKLTKEELEQILTLMKTLNRNK